MNIPEGPFCQSCAAPLPQVGACTGKGGKKSGDYCRYCCKGGAFTEPKMTLDQMKKRVRDYLVKEAKASSFEAMLVTETFLPGLKRWK